MKGEAVHSQKKYGHYKIAELNKHTKREICKDIHTYNRNRIMSVLEDTGSTRLMNKQLFNRKKWILALNNPLNSQKTNREDIVNIATDFYAKLYSNEEPNSLSYTNTSAAYVPWILPEEIENAIKHLKNSKCQVQMTSKGHY